MVSNKLVRVYLKNLKIFVIVALLSTITMGVRAQSQVECHLMADMVSNYIWRGQELGHVSLQPELSVAWKGLSLATWGSVGLTNHKDDVREIDLTLTYMTGGLSFGIVDYWDDGNDSRYFYYKQDGTGHAFEGFISYDFGPVSASWQTYFAGNDYQEDDGEHQSTNGKRAYSSYLELSAPFRIATCDWDAKVGLVPWKSGTYEVSGFSVTNLSLRTTKVIHITKAFDLPLFGQLVANPASQHFYFVFGLTLKVL
jgi:hypothetical protein